MDESLLQEWLVASAGVLGVSGTFTRHNGYSVLGSLLAFHAAKLGSGDVDMSALRRSMQDAVQAMRQAQTEGMPSQQVLIDAGERLLGAM